jgi:4-hydroxyproline epimerase
MGNNIFEKRQHFMKEYDWIRHGLMFEPRGHDMMSGSMIFQPSDPGNDIAVLFIETSGCLPMCGHGTIGTVTIIIEEGLVYPKTPGVLRLETPAGLVIAEYQLEKGKVQWVKLVNVPSYLAGADLTIQHELGSIKFDVGYGGNFYAIVDPQSAFEGVEHYTASELIRLSQELRPLINERYPDLFIHPENDQIRGVSHIMWTGKPLDIASDSRSAVFYGDKAIDRSPCGTGTSARMAQRFTKGLQKEGERFIHESFIGSKFIGNIEDRLKVGSFEAIVPSIQGWARITGYNHIIIDDDDPYAHGFQVI